MYTITWTRCNRRHSFFLHSFRCVFFSSFRCLLCFHSESSKFVTGRRWGNAKSKCITYSFWYLHNATNYSFTRGALLFDFCDCTNMDGFRRCVYIFHYNHPFTYRVGWFYERIYFNVVKFDGECCRLNWSRAFVLMNQKIQCVRACVILSFSLPYFESRFEYRACVRCNAMQKLRRRKNNQFASPLTFHISPIPLLSDLKGKYVWIEIAIVIYRTKWIRCSANEWTTLPLVFYYSFNSLLEYAIH